MDILLSHFRVHGYLLYQLFCLSNTCVNSYIQMYNVQFHHVSFSEATALQLQNQLLLHAFQYAFRLDPSLQNCLLKKNEIVITCNTKVIIIYENNKHLFQGEKV